MSEPEPAVYEAGGVRIEAVRYAGDGERVPFVLLHEGIGSIGLWRDFPAALAERTGRPVFVASRYGHGRSSTLDCAREPDYMHREAFDALPALLAAAGISRAILYGHSDGGSIALLAAAQYPALVAGLVLEAPHVVVEDITVASIAAVRERWYTTDLPQRLARYHDDAAATFFGWNDIWLDPRFRAWSITPYLPSIAAPVLALQGTADEYGTTRQTDLIAAGIAGARIVLYDGCGHAPHRERRAEVLAECASFSALVRDEQAPGETFPARAR